MSFSDIIGRADVSDALLPDQIINEIIGNAPQDSIVLNRARKVAMTSREARQPLVAALPDAHWLDSDTGLKQTTSIKWERETITAEELAVIVVIPDAVVDDSSVPLWSQVAPLLREAIGRKVDAAALFGTDAPASWPTGIIPGAIAAGNSAQLGPNPSLADSFLQIAEAVAADGFAVNGFATRPGMNWTLRGLKDQAGRYIFGAPTEGGHSTLFGQHLDEVRNGAWDPGVAEAVAVDWSKFVVGIRQDITYDLFTEGVISDEEGRVVLNLMQQDSKALRVVFRVGFAATIPATPTSRVGAYPAGVITPAE